MRREVEVRICEGVGVRFPNLLDFAIDVPKGWGATARGVYPEAFLGFPLQILEFLFPQFFLDQQVPINRNETVPPFSPVYRCI